MLSQGRIPTSGSTTQGSSINQSEENRTSSFWWGLAGRTVPCRCLAAQAKIMYSPGEPSQPKVRARKIARTSPSTSTGAPGSEVANSGVEPGVSLSHLKARRTSLLAPSRRTLGCLACHHNAFRATWRWRGCRAGGWSHLLPLQLGCRMSWMKRPSVEMVLSGFILTTRP